MRKNTSKLYLALLKIILMKLRNYLGLILVLLVCVACPNNDDDLIEVPVRDRGEQSVEDDELLVEYLSTHFYNYEEFENPPADFDYKIVFDTIAGDNSDKTPLINRPELKKKQYNRFDTDNSLYILQVREGSGVEPVATFTDSTLLAYEGFNLYGETFDATVNPIWLNLPTTIDGFANGLGTSVNLLSTVSEDNNVGFGGASGFTVEPDGTTSFNQDYGVGAVFVPSGLAYFNQPPADISLYGSIVFTFSVFDVVITDHDGDGIITINEDIDNNGFLFDEADNPDGDAVPAFRDPNDDNDGILTKLETVTDEDGNFVSLLDTDGDGINDHLDTDDDGDGRPTIDEIIVNTLTGEITYTDTDGDGTPDYLDSDS